MSEATMDGGDLLGGVGGGAAVAAPPQDADAQFLIHHSSHRGISDLFVMDDGSFAYEQDGAKVLVPRADVPVTLFPWTKRLLGVPDEGTTHTFETSLSLGDVRLRASYASHLDPMNTAGDRYKMVLRVLPNVIPPLASLDANPVLLEKFMAMRSGLFLVGGQTGSGKSTLIASMLDARTDETDDHLVTIEDPVEFIFPTMKQRGAMIEQRQVGRNVESFRDGLRFSYRRSPRIIFLGEIRDPETAAEALKAAASDHLVVSTLHAGTVEEAVRRILTLCEKELGGAARPLLASILQGIVCQKLLPGKEGAAKKRYVVQECAFNNQSLTVNIREGNMERISQTIELGSIDGMMGFRTAIKRRIDAQEIEAHYAVK